MSMELAVQVWKLDLDKTTAFVLMALCDVSDDDGTGCVGSDDYVMWKTGVSRATFFRTLARLEKMQVIKRVLRADGKTETLIALTRAPRKTPWREVRAQLRQSQNETKGGSQNETSNRASIKMRPGGSQNETSTVATEVPACQADSGAAASTPTNVIHPSYTSSSLAPVARRGASLSLAKTAEGTEELARSKADPRRAALTAALGRFPQYFGQPRTPSEWTLWNKRLTSLLAGGLVPADVGRAVNAWKRKYPQAQLTINALDLHLGELLPAPAPVALPVAYTPTPAPATEPTEPQEIEEIEHHAENAAPTVSSTPRIITSEEIAEREAKRRAASERARAALAASREAAALVPRRARLSTPARASLQV